MASKIEQMLTKYRTAALGTVRPDGAPHVTLVSYASDRLVLYAVVSEASQKFANLTRDPRTCLAIGGDFTHVEAIEELVISAEAELVRDDETQRMGVALICARHPELPIVGGRLPAGAAVIRFHPRIVTVVDFSQGPGHAEIFTIGADNLVEMQPARVDDWGFAPSTRRSPEIQWR